MSLMIKRSYITSQLTGIHNMSKLVVDSFIKKDLTESQVDEIMKRSTELTDKFIEFCEVYKSLVIKKEGK